MSRRSLVCTMIICAGMLIASTLKSQGDDDPKSKSLEAGTRQKVQVRLTIPAAKERSELMHQIYSATLDAMHHHYFRANRAVLPARAMEDVFADVARQTNSTARWISVNTKAMGVDHEPNSDFERKAASEIATGKNEFETVENGYYRRAGAIPLTAGCIGCHMGLANDPGKTPRYAALIISTPVQE